MATSDAPPPSNATPARDGWAARVVIVAEVRLHREGLAAMLASQPGVEVAATVDGVEALALAGTCGPDVIVMDMTDPMSTGRLGSISALLPGVKLLAFALLEAERDVLACVEAGVAGYVPRQASHNELADAVRRAARGDPACSPISGGALSGPVGASDPSPGRQGPKTALTPRELEVVGLIDRGLSNREIAERLCIELATVKNHVHHILTKMQVRHRGAAAARIRAERDSGGLRAGPHSSTNI